MAKLTDALERAARTCVQAFAGGMLAALMLDGTATADELPRAALAGAMAALVALLMYAAGPLAPRNS